MPVVPIFVSSFLGLELTRTENVETKIDLCWWWLWWWRYKRAIGDPCLPSLTIATATGRSSPELVDQIVHKMLLVASDALHLHADNAQLRRVV